MLGLLIGAAVASQLIDTIGEASNHLIDASTHAMKDKIFVNCSANDFYQKQYMEVIHAMLGMGFKNVNAVELRQHRQGLFTKNIYGQVESVSINGINNFKRGDRFAKEAHVVVSFHVFKDSPHVVIPELERNHRSQPVYEQPRYQQPMPPINVNVNIDNGPRDYGYQRQYNGNPNYGQQRQYNGNPNYGQQRPYGYEMPQKRCAYCGVLVPKHASFCSHCGAPF